MSGVSSQHSMVSIQGEPLATIVYQPEEIISDVVLVHGFTGSKEDFIDMAFLLAAQGHRVLTFDNRGGGSQIQFDESISGKGRLKFVKPSSLPIPLN